jgi:hypothetical protein
MHSLPIDSTSLNQAEWPCAGALVAGTFALMTAWANPEPGARIGLQEQRALLARKIVSNLFFLQQHPALAEPLRRVIAQTHQRWLPMAQSLPSPVAQPAMGAVASSQVH